MKILRLFAALAVLCTPATAAEQSSYVFPTGAVPGRNDLGALTATYYNPGLRALASCSSGPGAPANGPGGAPLQGQCWFDTSASPNIRLRYWDGSAWAPLASLDASAHSWVIATSSAVRSVATGSDTILDSDRGKLVDVSTAGNVAQGLPQPAAGGNFPSGWFVTIRNSGTGTTTITPVGSVIDGAASLPVYPGQSIVIRSDGTNYRSSLRQQPWNTNLVATAGLATAADKCQYWTGAAAAALMDCLAWSRAVTSAATAAAGRAAFGLAIGTDVQAQNANLAALSGLTGATGKVPYFTGPGAQSVFDSTSFGRSVSNVADAPALRSLAGLGNVQNTDTTTQANVAFTGLSAAGAAADADTLPVNQGAGNLKQTFAAIKTWVKGWIAKVDVGLGNVDNTSDVTKWAASKTLTNTNFQCDGTGNICKVRLGSDVTGILPKANGGTGASTISAAIDGEFGSTQGSVLYRGAGQWTLLPPGTAGQFLTTQGSGANPNWSSGGAGTGTVTQVICGAVTITASGTCRFPYFSAYLSANQTFTSGTAAKVQANTKVADSDTWYDAATNYRFTPQVAGRYRVNGTVYCAATTVTICNTYIYKNGSAYAQVTSTGNSAGQGSSVSSLVPMNGTTDYVELWVNIVCTGTCVAAGGNAPMFTFFEASLLSP